MQASVLNLLNAVDNQSGYFGRGDRSKVSQCGLHTKRQFIFRLTWKSKEIMKVSEGEYPTSNQKNIPLCS